MGFVEFQYIVYSLFVEETGDIHAIHRKTDTKHTGSTPTVLHTHDSGIVTASTTNYTTVTSRRHAALSLSLPPYHHPTLLHSAAPTA